MTRSFLRHIACMLGIHMMGLLMLSVMRLALYVAGHHLLAPGSSGEIWLQAQAFVHGVWFDNVIGCYILIVPLVLTSIVHLMGRPHLALKANLLWMRLLWLTAIAISACNIPYFLYFSKNINSSIWNWTEYGTTTLGMLLGEQSYYPIMAGYLLTAILFVYLTIKVRRHFSLSQTGKPNNPNTKAVWPKRMADMLGVLIVTCISVGLCLLGIRGRTGYNPIKVSAAYYCHDTFLNQLGINPSFNLLSTTLDDRRPENRRLNLMPVDEARQECITQMGRPLAYTLIPGGKHASELKGRNVILILMESMSYSLMGHGQTPFLDSLAHKSLFFSRCYSAGNHTNHGIFSTLYSFPALMFRNLMKGSNIPHYQGLPSVLHDHGYRNLFFMTHESQYDNMNAFLRTNGYDDIYAQENYPRKEVVNSFGVPDHFLYRYALQKLQQQKQPFMATLLSISNHPPYVIPEWFHANSEEEELQIVEYADDALRIFFKQAAEQPWYGNSVFVLLGDHGKLTGTPECEMPQCLNHIPLIIYAPGLAPEEIDSWCMQMDVQPTLLSLLGIRAEQEHFGQNILQKPRSMALYTADNMIGARSDGHLYIYEPGTGTEWFYKSAADNKVVYCEEPDSTLLHMKRTLFSTLQTAQEEIKKHE